MYNPFSLEGKTVLVTGASSGIGRATAIECAKMGATVVVTGRNADRLNETFGQLEGEGHTQILADLLNSDNVTKLTELLPSLDGLVHCAGLIKTVPFQFVNEENLAAVMDVNFTVPTLLSALLVKKKKLNKNSSVVFISSISGKYCSSFGNSIYTASKSAIDGIAKGMALDVASKGIRVNCVNPGMINTAILEGGVISQEQLDEDKKRYPLKRYGNPEEVAYAVIYLLSDASAWVTGSNLLIDGGYTLQ